MPRRDAIRTTIHFQLIKRDDRLIAYTPFALEYLTTCNETIESTLPRSAFYINFVPRAIAQSRPIEIKFRARALITEGARRLIKIAKLFLNAVAESARIFCKFPHLRCPSA